MKKQFVSLVLLLLVASTLLMFKTGVCGDSIKIGISNAQEGPASFLGTEFSKGAQAYFNSINEQNGINGKKIEVVQYDDGYEPENCIKNTKKLINEDNVLLLFGYVGTPTSKAVLPIIQSEKMPCFFPLTGAGFLRDVKKSSYVFNLRATYDMETEAMVDYLVKKGKNKIAIFYQNDAYGMAGLSGVKKALTKRDIELVSEGTYERNTVAVNKGLISIKKGSPEAIIMVGTYKPCAEFIKRAKKLGLKDVEFLNISFVGSKALAEELGDKGQDVIVTQVVPLLWNATVPAVKEYQGVLKKYFPDSEPGFVSLEGYLGAKLLVKVLEKAGDDLTSESLVGVSETMEIDLLGSGTKMSFSPSDHQGFNQVFMTKIVDGKFSEMSK